MAITWFSCRYTCLAVFKSQKKKRKENVKIEY